MQSAAEHSPAEEERASTPASLGFRMPAEWEPHERCILGWPTELRVDSVWGEQFLLAKASYAAVAHAILPVGARLAQPSHEEKAPVGRMRSPLLDGPPQRSVALRQG